MTLPVWSRPLLFDSPADGTSWAQMGHLPTCAFAFRDIAHHPPRDLDWHGAGDSGAPTSAQAAKSLSQGRMLYLQVVNYVVSCRLAGCTADQIEVDLGDAHPSLRRHQTASARMSEALHRGILEPSGLCRRTRSGKWAQALVDARLKPRWQCEEGCPAKYHGLWRLSAEGEEVPGWPPEPVRVHVTHEQRRELMRRSGDMDVGAWLLQKGLEAPFNLPPRTSTPQGPSAFLQRLKG